MDDLIRLEKVRGLIGGPVFGPVRSRRLGKSLGINPLPADLKICTFDCPYCECGVTSWVESRDLASQAFPPVEEILKAVRAALVHLDRHGTQVDSLTLTGNGETTLHPQFERLIDGVLESRELLLPTARVVVLTNATRVKAPPVRRALERVDQVVAKIDAGREETFRAINRPLEPITLDEITEAVRTLPDVSVQTMFVRGRVDNTAPEEIDAWIERLGRIGPAWVQIYSLERVPAESGLQAVERADLEVIAARLRERAGLTVSVY